MDDKLKPIIYILLPILGIGIVFVLFTLLKFLEGNFIIIAIIAIVLVPIGLLMFFLLKVWNRSEGWGNKVAGALLILTFLSVYMPLDVHAEVISEPTRLEKEDLEQMRTETNIKLDTIIQDTKTIREICAADGGSQEGELPIDTGGNIVPIIIFQILCTAALAFFLRNK